jgi:hypothetical protein
VTASPPWDADAARALSEGFALVHWPPRLDARIHRNSGWPHSSWTGDVCAVVNNEVAVLFVHFPAYAPGDYRLVSRSVFETTPSPFRYGPLPRLLCRRIGR